MPARKLGNMAWLGPITFPSFWHEVWFQLGISWAGAVSVIIATAVMYLFFTFVLSKAGPRLNARPSILSIGVTLLLGAIAARSMLGNSPTLLGGLIAMSVLILMEAIFRRGASIIEKLGEKDRWARRFKAFDQIAGHAIVIVADGEILYDHLSRRTLTPRLLKMRLRQAGITHLDKVGVVILEPRGALTIIRRGETIDRELLRDVEGVRHIPPENLS